MRISKSQREESLAQLREWLPPGSTVHLILRHVSKSGMSRDISPLVYAGHIHIIGKPGAEAGFIYPAWHVANVLGWRYMTGGNDAVRVAGCGMDMGFHLVYELSHALGYTTEADRLKHRWL